MGMWVCTYDWAHVLKLKIFEGRFATFGAQKTFVALYMVHPM
jgi:hypothetical protein